MLIIVNGWIIFAMFKTNPEKSVGPRRSKGDAEVMKSSSSNSNKNV